MQMTKNFERNLIRGFIGCGLWGGLGAYRGVQKYNKTYNKEYKYHLVKPTYYNKPQYYYISCFGSAMNDFVFYAFPPCIPFTIITELYNLERAIRGIEEE